MIRRLLGIALLASMAHIVIAGSDLVCATHGGHALSQEMPGMHHHSDAGNTEKEKCKVPARSDCCEAMTTCSANAALASVVDDEPSTTRHAGVVAFVAESPQTRLIPPDPPPPKA